MIYSNYFCRSDGRKGFIGMRSCSQCVWQEKSEKLSADRHAKMSAQGVQEWIYLGTCSHSAIKSLVSVQHRDPWGKEKTRRFHLYFASRVHEGIQTWGTGKEAELVQPFMDLINLKSAGIFFTKFYMLAWPAGLTPSPLLLLSSAWVKAPCFYTSFSVLFFMDFIPHFYSNNAASQCKQGESFVCSSWDSSPKIARYQIITCTARAFLYNNPSLPSIGPD